MSYAGPEFESPQPHRPRRRPLTLALAVLVPGALLGWLVYEGVGGAADGGGTPAVAHKGSSAAPPTASSTTAEDKKPLASLRGKVVVIDPGHNLTNFRHTAEINRKVDIGTNRKECDTTGTSTNSGYAEAKFTLDVAHRLRTLLERKGATVKLTQDGDRPYGPCVDERARIGNDAKADAVVSIHADGAGAGQRGYHVILPGRVHQGIADTRRIVGPSATLGRLLATDFGRVTGTEPSNYIGDGTGLDTRTDLGGLNLSTVPKVFIECGNMRDSKDAALLTSAAWRQKAAQGISEGIVSFLRG
ncbi:N-acetylmuramoyl-L-alanine amidase [Streptomyces griseorubiginosus]|uniref:N-acetylmuramoyl-L-alanine amidase n=1 Tax=Streptomyces griseorubiginosus TaxID=67304 RepID=UPI002E800266|nr:N-acetylmuramoyl-L-alanine amidase [Streptomyces griseorubiginosus]WUB47482.1 N-acetylmuramoyl-L-alanine amidase [Streptomyces griseorubiginosus]WUB56007.1 N-acetylmuramoyl-L-alanine amidase [Streptomyces griseorubiginosus]